MDRAAFACWDQIQRNTVLPDLPNYGLGCQGEKEKVFALLMVKSREEEGEKRDHFPNPHLTNAMDWHFSQFKRCIVKMVFKYIGISSAVSHLHLFKGAQR